jgi:hypothetical protein
MGRRPRSRCSRAAWPACQAHWPCRRTGGRRWSPFSPTRRGTPPRHAGRWSWWTCPTWTIRGRCGGWICRFKMSCSQATARRLPQCSRCRAGLGVGRPPCSGWPATASPFWWRARSAATDPPGCRTTPASWPACSRTLPWRSLRCRAPRRPRTRRPTSSSCPGTAASRPCWTAATWWWMTSACRGWASTRPRRRCRAWPRWRAMAPPGAAGWMPTWGRANWCWPMR